MFYEKHLFICTHQKTNGKSCCAEKGAIEGAEYLEKRLKEAHQWGQGKARLNPVKCLGRCSKGPCLLVYPEGRWYTYHSESDIDAIFESEIEKKTALPALMIDSIENKPA